MIFVLAVFVAAGAAFAEVDPPRKQQRDGVAPKDIICKDGYVLVMIRDKVPACVRDATAKILQDRLNATIVPQQKAPPQEKAPPQNEKAKTQPAPAKGPGAAIGGTTGKPSSKIESIPASGGSVANFYITDDDLNTSPNGVDIISTEGLVEFTINGIAVDGPATMIETGPNTGKFYLRLDLPDEIDGRPLTQNDIIKVTYHDQSDASGESSTTVSSLPLSKTYAQIATSGGGQRIGHEFTVTIYEPDANLDSKEVDRIPLSAIKFEAKGGIKTTLANRAFDANSSYLLETGESTGIFSVKIKIPRTIDGKIMDIGAWYKMTYLDTTTPSDTSEKVVLEGKIG